MTLSKMISLNRSLKKLSLKKIGVSPAGDIETYMSPGTAMDQGPFRRLDPEGVSYNLLLDVPLPEELDYSTPAKPKDPLTIQHKAASVQDFFQQVLTLSPRERSEKRFVVFTTGEVLYFSVDEMIHHMQEQTPFGQQFLMSLQACKDCGESAVTTGEESHDPYAAYGWNCRCPGKLTVNCDRDECPRRPNNPAAIRSGVE